MPELPDIAVYIEALERRIAGQRLEDVRIANPFLLRSVDPPLKTAIGREVTELRRLGKRIAIGLSGEYWLVLHLMIAGRLHWRPPEAKDLGRRALASFRFPTGRLYLTEAGSKRRASLHLTQGEEGLAAHDPGGLEVLDCSASAFLDTLGGVNHTLKRALTDPRLFSGIGNAYSDEILHRARLSPVAMTRSLSEEDALRLLEATRATLADWTERLRRDRGTGFPEKVTAFREGMAVHGRYGRPCPDCGTAVQRIRYADNETNYCPRCQTQGQVLADRSLSRLLKKDWPRTVEALEAMAVKPGAKRGAEPES